MTEAAIEWWGKAGQRSLERSALVEAAEQFTRALDHITTLPATPALRHEEMKFQVALITPLNYIKGYAAPETKSAVERARLLIEQAEPSESLKRIHCSCSRFSTTFGSRVALRSTAT